VFKSRPNTEFEKTFIIKHSTHTGRLHHQLLKVLFALCSISILFFASKVQAQENSNFYLHQNGVTVICDEAEIGESGEIDGITYTKRTRQQISSSNAATTCTSGIVDMNSLFKGDIHFNEDISHWDVSSVVDMSGMFEDARIFDRDINHWDVSNVTNMRSMFRGAILFNQDIGSWDVSNVTSMSLMFYHARYFNQDIGNWDVSNVSFTGLMFAYTNFFNQNIGSWDVSGISSMAQMFFRARSFNQDISKWDVSRVTNMRRMFFQAESFNGDISGWDVSNVTNMSDMFYGAESFNQDISDWDVGNVSDMRSMFTNARSFNQNLRGWCVGLIDRYPWGFNVGSAIPVDQLPRWGYCPDKEFELFQNYPNPFNSSTTISYQVPTESMVQVAVYDLLGRRVAILVDDVKPFGNYAVTFDASTLASGIYIYRIIAGEFTQSRKLMHLK